MKLYQTHWWRCNGPCQTRKPYFGIVRRSANRAPGPNDCWFSTHQRTCGGTFVKIKEPEKKTKKSAAEKKAKNSGDISKYVNKTINNNNTGEFRKPLTPLVKNVTSGAGTKTKSNGGNTVVITQKTNTKSPVSKPPSSQPPLVFSGKGETVSGVRKRTNSVDVAEAVRNVWANKKLPGVANSNPAILKRKSISNTSMISNNTISELNKQKADTSPPSKIKKIDDYFKSAATSILKDVYGEDFRITQSDDKIVAKKVNLVDCPVCSAKFESAQINRHLDECLNKDIIEKLSKDNIEVIDTQSSSASQPTNQKNLKDIRSKVPSIPVIKTEKAFTKMFKEENGAVKPIICVNSSVDLTNINKTSNRNNLGNTNNESKANFDTNDVNRVKAIVKKIHYDKHVRKSDNFVVVKEEPNNVDCGFLPSFLDDLGCEIKAPKIKIEPGTSQDIVSVLTSQNCPCCGNKIDKPMAEHLDECLAFFNNNTTLPEEGASTSFANTTIVIDDDDDDIFDETLTLNATGTKTPCPCCLEMIEMANMNSHLDSCLN